MALNNEIEELIRDEFNAGAPKDFDKISARCKELGLMQDESRVIDISSVKAKRKNKHGVWKILSVAALFVLVLGLSVMWNKLQSVPAYRVQIDVNPSIEIILNRQDKVIDYRAINNDAIDIVGKVDISNKSLTEVVTDTVNELVNAGYLNQENNSILISVMGKDQAKAEKIEVETLDIVKQIGEACSIELQVYNQYLEVDEDIIDIASKYGISEGKAALVKEIDATTEEDNSEKLSQMTVTELESAMVGISTATEESKNEETENDESTVNNNQKVPGEKQKEDKKPAEDDKTEADETQPKEETPQETQSPDEQKLELYFGKDKIEEKLEIETASEPIEIEAVTDCEDTESIVWSIESGEEVVSIESDGSKCKITGLQAGEATVVVTCGDEEITFKINVI